VALLAGLIASRSGGMFDVSLAAFLAAGLMVAPGCISVADCRPSRAKTRLPSAPVPDDDTDSTPGPACLPRTLDPGTARSHPLVVP
jgi:hypothetical protein